MSDNPLDPSPEHQAMVDDRARQLWEADGSPDGAMEEYRERADELVRMTMAGTPGQLPNPMTLDKPMPGVTVEEASIQQNLGEFPGGSSVADQGQWRETPMTRDELRHGDPAPPERGEAV